MLTLRTLRQYHHRNRRRYVFIAKFPFSSLSSPQPHSVTSDTAPKPDTLSARMSFVFNQIDAIEKERAEKDQTLQRIRAWRESKRQTSPIEMSPPPSIVLTEPELDSENDLNIKKDEKNEVILGLLNGKREVELVHPWPEWIGLMERLVQQNYFDHKRKDEDGMMENLGFNLSEITKEEGFDFTRDFKTVQNAVLNFGRDRFDILRSLSRQDLQVFVGYGCPSADKKVVFSAKLLRKLVHLDEGDVCSMCSLRSTCERAYLLTNKEDDARTIDVMRVLLTYGFDAVNGSVTNKPLLKMKSIKTVVRRLLHEVMKLSAVPIDPSLPPPVIRKPPLKVKQPPPPPKKRIGRDDIEMKKGDWLCPKCDFMNFAKNTICLQCDAKRPKRQLLPGEWECPQCNFLNYRRNMVCFHCEHKRPPDDFMDSQVQGRQQCSRRPEKVTDRREFSNAWNFDFDDNESDGADVAAFEYADSRRMDEDFPLNMSRRHEDGYSNGNRQSGLYEKDSFDAGAMEPGLGFNDFDDEDDDLDSYELDTGSAGQKFPAVNFSELEDEGTTDEQVSNFRTKNNPASKSSHRPVPDNEDFGSDDDLPVHPNWKSSHVMQFDKKSEKRGAMSFGSDDEVCSDTEEIEHRKRKGKIWNSSSSSRREENSDFEDESSSDTESHDNSTHLDTKCRFGNRGSQQRGLREKNLGWEDSDIESNAKTCFGSRGSRGSLGRRRNFVMEDSSLESNPNTCFGRGGGFSNKGWGSHKRGNPSSEDEMLSDSDAKNSSRFCKEERSRNKGRQFGGKPQFYSERNSKKDSYGGRSDFQRFKSPRSEGSSYKQRSGNQRGDSYLDNERFRRPRVNVR